ncbi:GNAT family N-acetyltransferase [Kaistella palustris]|uniref:GNAT family N-acetyltransferase n=1 Tax=Kaistella palustris TaxID=493376 RepID=UPI0004260DE4|nr:GNAT family N-acetyltransferase [Kaistella palustris]
MEDLEIDFKPTFDDLNQIKSWGSNLDSNFSTILQSLNSSDLIVAKYKNEIVSYFACSKKEVTIFISLAETKKEFQKKGIAGTILKTLITHFKSSHFKAFYLYCSPQESQYFWTKVGFKYFPKDSDHRKIFMYKIFGEVKSPEVCNDVQFKDYIEIWDKEWPDKNETPKWICELEFKKGSNELLKPILFFGNCKWQIKVVKNNTLKILRYKELDRNSEIYECFYIPII